MRPSAPQRRRTAKGPEGVHVYDVAGRRTDRRRQRGQAASFPGAPVAGAHADWSDARYQAFALLRIAFIVAPIAFGLDKFFNVMVEWPIYLAPWINDIAPGSGQDFMYLVGAIEIVAGVAVALKPRYGAYVVAGLAGGHRHQPAHRVRLLRHRAARLRPHARRPHARPPGLRLRPPAAALPEHARPLMRRTPDNAESKAAVAERLTDVGPGPPSPDSTRRSSSLSPRLRRSVAAASTCTSRPKPAAARRLVAPRRLTSRWPPFGA